MCGASIGSLEEQSLLLLNTLEAMQQEVAKLTLGPTCMMNDSKNSLKNKRSRFDA